MAVVRVLTLSVLSSDAVYCCLMHHARETEDAWLTVGEVARHAGLSVRTLHHWDERGLLVPSGRSTSDYRLYSPDDLRRLLQIQHLKSLGLSLDEVGAALDADDFDARAVLEDHITEVEQRIDAEQHLLRTLNALREPAETGWREVLSAVAQTERLRHPEPHVRFRAALGSTSGVPLEDLVRQLAADPEPGVREVLTWAIARHGNEARDALLPLLTHDDPVVRAQAAHALSKVGDAGVVPRIAPLLGDLTPFVAAKAAQVLGRLGGPDAWCALTHALGSGPEEVDDAVVAALEHAGSDAVHLLIPTLRNASPRVRAGAAEALGLIGDPAVAPTLAPLLGDEDRGVRFEAIVALGQLSGDAAEAAIEEARVSPDDRLRQVAARLLRDRAATPRR